MLQGWIEHSSRIECKKALSASTHHNTYISLSFTVSPNYIWHLYLRGVEDETVVYDLFISYYIQPSSYHALQYDSGLTFIS